MAYSEKLLDHYDNPRNIGSFGKNEADVGTGLVGAPACGDVMKLQIKVGADGRIADAKFKTFGCGSAIASSSLATEWVKGKTLDEAEKIKNTEIAQRVGVSRPTVIHWRDRYLEGGLAALQDRKRSGRPPRVDEAQVVAATLTPPPERLGVTHWSSRLLAAELGIGFATVARIWRDWKLQPWRVETFKFSTNPQLEAKIRDVVGLYLNPRAPRGADDSSGGEKPSPPGLSQQ